MKSTTTYSIDILYQRVYNNYALLTLRALWEVRAELLTTLPGLIFCQPVINNYRNRGEVTIISQNP